LFGPVPNVVARLSIGDFLNVQLLAESHPPSIAVFTQGAQAQQAGTITGTVQLPQLVECLQQGHEYQAKVVHISGSTVTLQVSRI
jgi:hypothetical protein